MDRLALDKEVFLGREEDRSQLVISSAAAVEVQLLEEISLATTTLQHHRKAIYSVGPQPVDQPIHNQQETYFLEATRPHRCSVVAAALHRPQLSASVRPRRRPVLRPQARLHLHPATSSAHSQQRLRVPLPLLQVWAPVLEVDSSVRRLQQALRNLCSAPEVLLQLLPHPRAARPRRSEAASSNRVHSQRTLVL